LGVGRIQGVLGVDDGGEAAGLLGLGDDVQGEGGLAARVPELEPAREASSETPESTVSASDDVGEGDGHAEQEKPVSWWRKLLG
jgi:hypothetical protein